MRALVELDAQRDTKELGPVGGVLVTGDIAASHHNTEYARARVWLERLRAAIGCASRQVWTVPGNHDVDRSVLDSQPGLHDLHARVRDCNLDQASATLSSALTDRARPGLMAPLDNYVTFFETDRSNSSSIALRECKACVGRSVSGAEVSG